MLKIFTVAITLSLIVFKPALSENYYTEKKCVSMSGDSLSLQEIQDRAIHNYKYKSKHNILTKNDVTYMASIAKSVFYSIHILKKGCNDILPNNIKEELERSSKIASDDFNKYTKILKNITAKK